nr:N-acetylmuramoyl-L-alanine amidase [uncultured Bacteroides sp.]
MREINLIVIHCTATRSDQPFTQANLERSHRERGFNGIGYHYYIRRDGSIKSTRPLDKVGAHAKGYNAHSIGICYEGGLNALGKPTDTRTEWQRHSLRVLLLTLLRDYPGCRIVGHRDLSPDLDGDGVIESHEWLKACPCFDAGKEYSSLK